MKKRAGNGCGGTDDGRTHRYVQLHTVKLVIDAIQSSKIINTVLFLFFPPFLSVCLYTYKKTSYINKVYCRHSILRFFFSVNHKYAKRHQQSVLLKLFRRFWKHSHFCLQIYHTWPSKPRLQLHPIWMWCWQCKGFELPGIHELKVKMDNFLSLREDVTNVLF